MPVNLLLVGKREWAVPIEFPFYEPGTPSRSLHDFAIFHAENGYSGITKAAAIRPDIIIADSNLDHVSTADLITRLQTASDGCLHMNELIIFSEFEDKQDIANTLGLQVGDLETRVDDLYPEEYLYSEPHEFPLLIFNRKDMEPSVLYYHVNNFVADRAHKLYNKFTEQQFKFGKSFVLAGMLFAVTMGLLGYGLLGPVDPLAPVCLASIPATVLLPLSSVVNNAWNLSRNYKQRWKKLESPKDHDYYKEVLHSAEHWVFNGRINYSMWLLDSINNPEERRQSGVFTDSDRSINDVFGLVYVNATNISLEEASNHLEYAKSEYTHLEQDDIVPDEVIKDLNSRLQFVNVHLLNSVNTARHGIDFGYDSFLVTNPIDSQQLSTRRLFDYTSEKFEEVFSKESVDKSDVDGLLACYDALIQGYRSAIVETRVELIEL